jgi:hypothetical protein
MNIIHMDLRVHRGFGNRAGEKRGFRRERRPGNAKKKAARTERLERPKRQLRSCGLTGERAEGVG